MGKTYLTDKLINKICDHIARGNYIQTSVIGSGVPPRTYYLWMNKGQEDEDRGLEPEDSVYVRLMHRSQIAHQKAELDLVSAINDKYNPGKCWILDRTRQGRYSQNQRIEVSQTITGTLDINSNPPSDHTKWLESVEQKQLEEEA
jgi:hypothetical protein